LKSCRRISGFPFFTEIVIMSPIPAAGYRRAMPPIFATLTISTIRAPVLSAHVNLAPVGSPRVAVPGIPFIFFPPRQMILFY
jgi:hypothetical protein